MFKVALGTDNPSALLHQVDKGHGYMVEDDVRIKNELDGVVMTFNMQDIPHPVRDFFGVVRKGLKNSVLAVGRFIKKVMVRIAVAMVAFAMTLLSLLAAAGIAMFFLYGLVGIFSDFDYTVASLVALGIFMTIGLFMASRRQERAKRQTYVQRYEPNLLAHE